MLAKILSYSFCLLTLAWAARCTESDAPPVTDIHFDIAEEANSPGSPKGTPALDERLDEFQRGRLRQPYALLCYYSFVDTLESESLEKCFHAKLNDILTGRIPTLVRATLQPGLEHAENLMETSSAEDLSQPFLQATSGCEWAMAILLSPAQKLAQVRYLHIESGKMTPVISLSLEYPVEAADEVARILPKLVGLEGYVVETRDREVVVALRGNAVELERFGGIADRIFWVFTGKSRVRDCVVYLEKASPEKDYLRASGRYLGLGAPKPGMRVIGAYLPGGSQTFRVVNEQGHPQAGFSVFWSYQEFSTKPRDYLGTTDPSGEFILADSQKKPIFLVITRNIEGVNLAFLRKLVVVEPDKGVATISVSDFQEIEKGVGSISEKLNAEDIEAIQKLARNYLSQAQEHIGRQELKEAILSIRMARQHLKRVEHVPGQDEIRVEIENVEKKYQELWEQEEALSQYTSALTFIEEMDKAVLQMDYTRAQKMLERVRKLWPQKYYDKEFQEVEKRQKRLDILVRESALPLGKARAFLFKDLPQLKADQVNSKKLGEVHEQLKILFTEGEDDPDQIYNDLDLRLQTRLSLDTLSTQLLEKALQYEKQYHEAVSPQQRREIYEIYENYYRFYRTIDDWLKTYQ